MIAITILLGLPFLTAAALSLPQVDRVRFWLDLSAGLVTLAAALSLAWWPSEAIPLLRHDGLAVLTAILAAVASLAAQWDDLPAERHVVLGGMILAAVAAHPMLMDAGLAIAVAAALRRHIGTSWYCVPFAGAGFGFLLFGAITPPGPLESGCVLLGLATLAVAAPVLLPILPLLALRYGGFELVPAGLAALVGCAAGRLIWPSRDGHAPWISLGQAGVVLVAFGLNAPDATFIGLLLSALLVLSQAARGLATGDGLTSMLAAAGLAGLPPFGVFPGLALTVAAVAVRMPWLLAALLPGLGVLGWVTIRSMPAVRVAPADRWSPAWIPLVAAILLGWFMPAPVADWLRSVAMEVHG